jgi:hypothetical protein
VEESAANSAFGDAEIGRKLRSSSTPVVRRDQHLAVRGRESAECLVHLPGQQRAVDLIFDLWNILHGRVGTVGVTAGTCDSFLSTWVPLITSSPAFRKDGLLEITFDESANSDTAACCREAPGPGSPAPGITGPGGGLVGPVVLSPFVQPGIVVGTPYNHYSLATVEALFGVRRLGASATVSTTFGSDIFSSTRHQ